MASFPSAVKTFTSKNSGDVIQAATDNDEQDEINAIEDALLNGNAALLSSNFTVRGGLQANAGSSFVIRPRMPHEGVFAYLSNSKDIGSSAAATLEWEAFVFNSTDANSTRLMWNVASPTRLYPISSGVYRFTAQIVTLGVPSTTGYLGLAVHDSSNSQLAAQLMTNSTVYPTAMQVSGVKYFDSTGSYVTVIVTSPATSTHQLAGTAIQTWATMTKV